MTIGFNKREFARFVAARFNVPQEEGMLFFEEIGQKVDESLNSGGTVFLFGKGTLKVVKKRGASDDMRIRFRPSKRGGEKGVTVAIEGLSGVAAGVIEDVVVITSVSAGERALHVGRACTAIGVSNSITVYKDDGGLYRCLVTREGAAPDESILKTKRAVKEWLRAFFPSPKL
jgi:hypothetical protein